MDSEQIRILQEQQQNSVKYKEGALVQAINFASYNTPLFKEKMFKEWINCGQDNLWPNYLLSLLNGCPMHSAIIDGKAKQVCGEGITVEDSEDKDQLAQMNSFLKQIKFNKKTLKRIALDQQIFGYWFLGITWSADRTKIANIYHVDASTVRVGKPDKDTRIIDYFYYSEDWTQFRKKEFKPDQICRFDPNKRIDANALLMVRGYKPNTRFYNLPLYNSCRNQIETVSELSEYILSSVRNGLSPSLSINFSNGIPTEEERSTIYRSINSLYKGGKNAGKFILSFSPSKDNATTVEPIDVSNQSQVYSSIIKDANDQIIVGHKLTSPILAGVAIPGQLGGLSSDIERASESFYNFVIAPCQIEIEEVIQELLEVNGWNLKIWIKDSNPITYTYDDTTLLNLMTIDEMRARINLPPLSDFDKKNLGINITQPVTATPAATPVTSTGMSDDYTTPVIPVNDNIKNLTTKQHQQLLRVIRQYSKGVITKDVATVMLKTGLGLSDDDISKMLPDVEEEDDEMSIQTPDIKPYINQIPTKKKDK